MKHYFLSLLILLAIIFPVAGNFITPAQVAAASSCPSGAEYISETGAPNIKGGTNTNSSVQLGLCLVDKSGNPISDPSSYSISFTYTNLQGIKSTGSATYSSKYNSFLTGALANSGNPSNSGCVSGVAKQPFSAYIKKGGKTYGSYSTDLCSMQSAYTHWESVSISQSAVQEGYITGTITYVAADGSTPPFNGASSGPNEVSPPYLPAQGTITNSSGSVKEAVILDANGNIQSPTELPVGNYTFSIQWNPPTTSAGTSIGIVNYSKSFTVTSANTANNPVDLSGTAKNSASGSEPSPGSSGGSAVSTTPDCENSFSLSWILCSVISGAANLITGLYHNLINPLLDQPQSSMLLDTSKPYYNVWSSFRIYGDIILVIALLVIVFGESIGGGMIDAYTAKKVLPRLLVAAVLINLSIYIVAIAVDITSVLGNGIYGLFVYPFHNAKFSGLGLHLNIGGDLLTTLGLGTATIWVATAGGGFLHFLFVTVLGGGSLVFFGVMLTLVLRIALILGLIFVSPVAFALYCLPNTEQYFRKWWDLLFRALLVFPIVGAIFALSNITAYTLSNLPLSGIANSFAEVLALFGQFAPLIMVPFAFRMAGGAIGAIHQGINGAMVAPGLKGIAGVRARRRQVLHERRMGGEGRMGSGAAGTLYRGAATLGTREGWTPTRRGRSRFAAYNQKAMGQLSDKRLEEAGPRAFANDDVSAVMSRGLAGDAAISELTKMENPITKENYTEQEARDAISRAEVATGLTAGSDAMQIAAQKYRTAMSPTAYKGDIAGTEDHRDDLMRLVDRGLITQEDAASWMKSNRSRSDYSGGSWGGTNEFLRGKKGDGSAAIHLQDAFAGADPREMLANHQFGVEAMADQANIRVQTAAASGNSKEIEKAIADAANIHNQLSATSPRKADAFADAVFSQGSGLVSRLPYDGPLPQNQLSVQALVKEARERPELYPEFHNRSREYGSGVAAAGAGAIGGGGAPDAGTPGGAPGGAPDAGTPHSDKRLKTDIIFIETLSNGINLYSFKYVWGGPMYVGVMAQELLQSHPEAISKGPDGYYRVNYGMLGLEMMRLEEYLERETVYI